MNCLCLVLMCWLMGIIYIVDNNVYVNEGILLVDDKLGGNEASGARDSNACISEVTSVHEIHRDKSNILNYLVVYDEKVGDGVGEIIREVGGFINFLAEGEFSKKVSAVKYSKSMDCVDNHMYGSC